MWQFQWSRHSRRAVLCMNTRCNRPMRSDSTLNRISRPASPFNADPFPTGSLGDSVTARCGGLSVYLACPPPPPQSYPGTASISGHHAIVPTHHSLINLAVRSSDLPYHVSCGRNEERKNAAAVIMRRKWGTTRYYKTRRQWNPLEMRSSETRVPNTVHVYPLWD